MGKCFRIYLSTSFFRIGKLIIHFLKFDRFSLFIYIIYMCVFIYLVTFKMFNVFITFVVFLSNMFLQFKKKVFEKKSVYFVILIFNTFHHSNAICSGNLRYCDVNLVAILDVLCIVVYNQTIYHYYIF